MKKYLMFVLALLFTFVLASCELNINQSDLSNSSETSQESTISDLSEIKDEDLDDAFKNIKAFFTSKFVIASTAAPFK